MAATHARIFDIQKFSIHDGPGIRTLVFFKGCPLRCRWCSNPESQRPQPEMMHFDNLCTRCSQCAAACARDCITVDAAGRRYDPTRCEACGACIEACPHGAIKRSGRDMTVDEVLAVVEQDYLFYLNSGGGVTLGGGEPTMQPEAARELLQRCRRIAIHTAMETCGHCDWAALESLLPFLDLVLFDVKHMDADAHHRFTGLGNALILSNLRRLLAHHTPALIRVPLIPGFNDDTAFVEDLAAFLAHQCDTASLTGIELLPYHRLGVGKYDALGRAYSLDKAQTPPAEVVAALQAIAQSHGFRATVQYL